MYETFEERIQLMKSIGPGGLCLVNGRVQKLIKFYELAGIYEFSNPDGSSGISTYGDEAFAKGIDYLAPLPAE